MHGGQLYIYSSSESKGCFLQHTSDLIDWHELPPPPNTFTCYGLLSHSSFLYFLSRPTITHDPDRHPVLFQLSDSHQDASADSTPTWVQLPNGRCPIKQLVPAFFGFGHRLVLAGGSDGHNSLKVVSEYCLETHRWLAPTDWPLLPYPSQQHHVVSLSDYIHLVSPIVKKEGKSSGRSSVLSLKVEKDRPPKEWSLDLIPSTAHPGCGACRILGTIAVAGGAVLNPLKLFQDVYNFDGEARTWLKLPSLTVERCAPSLVFFKGRLLAMGGVSKTYEFLSSIEQLALF